MTRGQHCAVIHKSYEGWGMVWEQMKCSAPMRKRTSSCPKKVYLFHWGPKTGVYLSRLGPKTGPLKNNVKTHTQVPMSKQPRIAFLVTMLIRAHTRAPKAKQGQHCQIVQQKCHHPYPVPLLYTTTTTTTIVIVLLLISTATYCRLDIKESTYTTNSSTRSWGEEAAQPNPAEKSTYKVHTTGA